MSLRISLEGKFSASVAADLKELSQIFGSNGIVAKANTVSVDHLKADLMVGLTIASFGVTAVGTTMQAISFWQSQKRKYRLTVDAAPQALPLQDPAARSAIEAAVAEGRPVRILIEQD